MRIYLLYEVSTLRISLYFLYAVHIFCVHRTSYICRYADTFIVIYFFKDNQFLLFIVLICCTCKCFIVALYRCATEKEHVGDV